MPALAGVAVELRSFRHPNQGDRHDHREESSTKETDLARVGEGAGQREQSLQDHRLFTAAVLRNPP